MSNMVSWKDYEGIDGFGSATMQDVSNLNKALRAGQSINPPGSVTAGDGFSLRVESLESTLRSTQYRMSHIRLWKMCTKLPAFNTVEEYNLLESFGDNIDAGFIDEGDLPNEDDSKYERKFAVVKYLGTLRRVTHVMSLVRPANGMNVINKETVNGTMHLLRMTERALFVGDSSLSSLQFDGYEKLMVDGGTTVIDLRGKPLSEDLMVDAALIVSDAPGYGTPTDFYANPAIISDISKVFAPKERVDPFRDRDGIIRTRVAGWESAAGPVMFQPDVFITDGGPAASSAVGDATKRPATPTESTAPASAGTGSLFAAADVGTYQYAVVAVNRYGRSAKLQLTAVATVVDEEITAGVTPANSTPSVEWYEVYRSLKGGAVGSERLILRVPNAAGTGEQDLVDVNAKLPGTTSGYLFQGNTENMAIKQLAPLVKIPLATVDTSIRWMQLLYIVPVLYTPLKNVLFHNIGRAIGSETAS